MADGSQWFYVAGNERKGPLGVAQMATLLDAGTIDEATLVRTDSMASWAPLRETPLYRGSAAPPLPTSEPHAAGDISAVYEPPVAGFGQAVSTCFRKYVTFSGRASRPEFWWFTLFVLLGASLTTTLDGAVFRPDEYLEFGIRFSLHTYWPLNSLFSLAILLPSLGVSVRRLHDTDRAGWWVLLHFIPIVGTIILIFWFCGRGTPGRNRFG